ncbi:MAG: amidohydrolase family protein [Gemmatimonadota bacterium]|nr:MAG: amidohydrolase family protein [Gemmatimonadota bacterium]
MRGTIRAFAAVPVLVAVLASCDGQEGQIVGPSEDEVTAFVDVRLVPMTGELTIENQTVLVDGRTIVQIGQADDVAIPEGATVIDGAGAYLMPGLADMHVHTRLDWLSDTWPVSPLLLYLANGVTTIRDFRPSGGDLTYPLGWRAEINAGVRDGPTLYTSGRRLFASPVDDPQGTVQWNHARGFDFQKFYSYLSYDDFHAGMTAAGQLFFYTVGHIPFPVGLDVVLTEGIDEIAHVEELVWEFVDYDRNAVLLWQEWLPYVIGVVLQQIDISQDFDRAAFLAEYGDRYASVISSLDNAGITICTTMIVDDIIVQKLFEPAAFLSRPEIQYMPSEYLQSFSQGTEKHQVQFNGIEGLATYKYGVDKTLLDGLHQANVSLVLGTDSGTGQMGIVPGFSIHDELRVLVENGFSPYEAIATATLNASRVVEDMIGEDDFGTIEVGKRADLILLNGDPLADLSNIRDLRGVMAAGRWYGAETLQQMLAIGS